MKVHSSIAFVAVLVLLSAVRLEAAMISLSSVFSSQTISGIDGGNANFVDLDVVVTSTGDGASGIFDSADDSLTISYSLTPMGKTTSASIDMVMYDLTVGSTIIPLSANTSSMTFQGTNNGAYSVGNFELTISAVPEPNPTAFMAVLFAAMMSVRRRFATS